LSRPAKSPPRVAGDAPPELIAATKAVREVILEYDDYVHGWCVEASMILGWMLRQEGLPAEMRSCTALGTDPHWCVKSGEWILDPTAGQWGSEPVLVFREGSRDDWYGPGLQGPAEISEEEIAGRFHDWVGPEAGHALLSLAGLEHLSPTLSW
jgi:hypothetical protein